MRLLLDESLSARSAPLLPQAGHDVVHAADLDLLGEPDDVVLSAAPAEGRTVVTADTDFGALLALSRAPAPSVLLLRRGGRRLEQRAQQILLALMHARAPWSVMDARSVGCAGQSASGSCPNAPQAHSNSSTWGRQRQLSRAAG